MVLEKRSALVAKEESVVKSVNSSRIGLSLDMAPEAFERKFGFSNKDYDWERYARVRPKYKDSSVWDRVLQYHTAHDGGFDQAHDIGTGYGVVARDFLAKHFNHVYASDPSQLDSTKQFLAPLIAEGKVTAHQAAAEDQWLPPGSVDMVTAFECLHWSNPEKTSEAVAAQLKPGGTFVALYYAPRPFIRNNRRADAAWKKIYDICAEQWTAPNTTSSKFLPHAYHGLNSHVSLPTELFDSGARRIRVNAELMSLSPHWSPEEAFRVGASHRPDGAVDYVGSGEICEDVVDEEGWSEVVDAQWLEDSLLSFQTSFPLEQAKEEFEEIREAIAQEGGKITILWMVDMVLATRRSR